MRWLWVDRFTAFEPGVRARAIKNVTFAEEHLSDHFPGFPVAPASLIIEGMAQTGGILVGHARQFTEKVILAKILKAVFTREALPGDQLTLESEVIGGVKEEGASTVGKVYCNGEHMADIDMMFVHLDRSGNKVDAGTGNFVFDAQFLQLISTYRLDSAAPAVAPGAAAPPADKP